MMKTKEEKIAKQLEKCAPCRCGCANDLTMLWQIIADLGLHYWVFCLGCTAMSPDKNSKGVIRTPKAARKAWNRIQRK